MATKLENLHKKSSDIVEVKGELLDSSQKNQADLSSIKELLNGSLSDTDNISALNELNVALEKDATDISAKTDANEVERTEALTEVDSYIEALEGNLGKIQEIKSTSDLVKDSVGSDSTKIRLKELEDIRSMLEGECYQRGFDNDNVSNVEQSYIDKHSEFADSLKVQVEPQIRLTTEEKLISEIMSADNKRLAEIVKEQNLSSSVDFGNLDVVVSRQMVQSIYETRKQFDFLDMKFIGSIQARNKKIETSLLATYMAAYKNANPEWSDADLKPYVIEAVKKEMEKILPSQNTMAQSVYIDKPYDTLSATAKTVCGISINESYGSNYDAFKKVKEHEVIIGHKPIGCDTAKATIDHELGHQIAHHLNASKDSVIIKEFNAFSALDDSEKPIVLSSYAQKNISEFIAECWSEYQNNPNCRRTAKNVSKRLIQLHSAFEIGPKIKEIGYEER